MRSVMLMIALAAGCAAASFHVEVKGKGQPMILIPGLSSAGEVWDGTVAQFSDRYECHVVTLAGFAGQPRIEKPFLETVRKELAAYIREKKLKKPVITGHSLGGFLALSLAEEEPGLVGPLVIVDSLPFLGGTFPGVETVEQARKQAETFYKMMSSQTQEQYEAYIKSGMMLKTMITAPEYVARATEWGLRSDKTAVADAYYELLVTDLRPGLGKIASPALVMGSWAGMKQFATREQIRETFRKQYAGLADVRVVLSENGKHFLMYDDPAWMFGEMEAFLTPKAVSSK